MIEEKSSPIMELKRKREVDMKINLPKSAKSQIKAARKKVFDEMNAEFISQTTWDEMNKRYQGIRT